MLALVTTSGLCTSGGLDLILTVAPELVGRHWWHRILHEHVGERLQLILQSLPRVVVTGVPFHLAD
jgi:hypothetical protein